MQGPASSPAPTSTTASPRTAAGSIRRGRSSSSTASPLAVIEAHDARQPAKLAIGSTDVWGSTRNRSLDPHVHNDTVIDKRQEPQRKFASINPELELIRVDTDPADGSDRTAVGHGDHLQRARHRHLAARPRVQRRPVGVHGRRARSPHRVGPRHPWCRRRDGGHPRRHGARAVPGPGRSRRGEADRSHDRRRGRRPLRAAGRRAELRRAAGVRLP